MPPSKRSAGRSQIINPLGPGTRASYCASWVWMTGCPSLVARLCLSSEVAGFGSPCNPRRPGGALRTARGIAISVGTAKAGASDAGLLLFTELPMVQTEQWRTKGRAEVMHLTEHGDCASIGLCTASRSGDLEHRTIPGWVLTAAAARWAEPVQNLADRIARLHPKVVACAEAFFAVVVLIAHLDSSDSRRVASRPRSSLKLLVATTHHDSGRSRGPEGSLGRPSLQHHGDTSGLTH